MSKRKTPTHRRPHPMQYQAPAAQEIAAAQTSEADSATTGGIEPSHIDLSNIDSSRRESRHNSCHVRAADAEAADNKAANARVDGTKADDDATGAEETQPESWSTQAALLAIRFYQRCVSPFTPPSCRFYPSCSHYAYGSIRRFGFWRGGWMGLKRICKCHPFHPGGYDPVPELQTKTGKSSTREMKTRNEHLENRHLI